MKKTFTLLLLIFAINESQGQNYYELQDNKIFLKYSVMKKGEDSLKINAILRNISKQKIWVTDDNFIFDPGIEGESLYLNIGLDVNKKTPMDIVPFALKELKPGDSISFNTTKKYSYYTNATVTCNYLLKEDYDKILKKKQFINAIGSLDYNRSMQSISSKYFG
jgi:hypothetical protein